MKFEDTYRQPGYLFRRMHQLATAAFSTVAVAQGLTAVQFSALIAIRDHAGIDATRLSELIRYDRTTIGQVLGRLERKGMLKRSEGGSDKRVKLLHITPSGQAALEEVIGKVGTIAEILLEPLDPDERKTLLTLLQKLDRHAG